MTSMLDENRLADLMGRSLLLTRDWSRRVSKPEVTTLSPLRSPVFTSTCSSFWRPVLMTLS